MGLVITAYKGVKLVNEPALDEYGDIAGKSAKQVVISIGNSEWEQGDDLEAGQVYEFSDVISAYSSSCSTYGNLRNELARIAGYEPTRGANKPYANSVWEHNTTTDKSNHWLLCELINFADNEGEIGTKTTRKILNDLHAILKHSSELNEWNQGLLTDLIQTFEFAAVDGFVQFQ